MDKPDGEEQFKVVWEGSPDPDYEQGGSFYLSKYAENGVWTLDSFNLLDNAGNEITLDTQELIDLGIETELLISGGWVTDTDITPPELISFELPTYSINLLEQDEDYFGSYPNSFFIGEIFAVIVDDQSGVYTPSDDEQILNFNFNETLSEKGGNYNYAIWTSPSGNEQFTVTFVPEYWSDISDQFQGSFSISKYAEKGIWTLDSFYLTDNSGNQSVLSTDELIELGIETELLISGGLEDKTAPQLVSYELPSYSIDLSDPQFSEYLFLDGSSLSNEESITAEIIDNESGVVSLHEQYFAKYVYPDAFNLDNYATYALWISPSGDEQFITPFGAIDEDNPTGNFDGDFKISKYAENGIWTLDSFYMLDYAGNQSVLSTDELIELGIETNFLVTGSQADTTAPQLVSYELPTYSIDLSDPQFSEYLFLDGSSLSNEESITAEIIDNESGVVSLHEQYFAKYVYPDAFNLDNYATYALWISPSGDEQFITPFGAIDEDNPTGNFDGDFKISKYAENGIWTLDSFYMLDYAGNQSVLSTDELIELGIETNFLVTGSQADTTAPQLVSYELPTYSIDLSDPQFSEYLFLDGSSLSNEESITAEIIDNESGVVSLDEQYFAKYVYPDAFNLDNYATYALWISPSGDEQFITPFGAIDEDNPTGNFDGDFKISKYAENGIWTLDSFYMLDYAGNQSVLSTDELIELGIETNFLVTGSQADTTAPQLVSFELPTYSINLLEQDEDYFGSYPNSFFIGEIFAVIVDDQSGVYTPSDDEQILNFNFNETLSEKGGNYNYAIWTSPSGNEQFTVTFVPEYWSDISDQFQGSFSISKYAEKGIWTLDSFYLTDNSGNQSVLSTDELIELGIETELLISGGLEDKTAPQLVSYELPSYSIDLSDPQFSEYLFLDSDHLSNEESITAEIIDNESGVVDDEDAYFLSKVYPDAAYLDNSSTYAVWISPSGDEQFVSTEFWGDDGDLFGDLYLSKYAENGIWTLDSFYMLDYAGNQSVLSTDELIELGIETNFLVTGSQADTTAPQLVSFELPTYSIDLSDPQFSGDIFVNNLYEEESITAEIIDNESGVVDDEDAYFLSKVYPDAAYLGNSSTYAVWISPSGDGQFVTTFYGGDGDLIGDLYLSKYAENGIWTLDSFYMLDYAGNQSVLSTDELIDLGIETNFLVTGSQADTTAPQLVSYELPTYSIDLSDPQFSGDIFVNDLYEEESITAEIIDNESGVVDDEDAYFLSKVYPDAAYLGNSSTYAVWISPSGDEQFVTTFYGGDGDLIGDLYLSKYAENGIWTLDSFYMLDYAGNQSVLSTDELIELGIETNFLVTGSQADTTAPQLVSFELPTYSINLLEQDEDYFGSYPNSFFIGEIFAVIVDDQSGVYTPSDDEQILNFNFNETLSEKGGNYNYAIWTSPSGNEQFTVTFVPEYWSDISDQFQGSFSISKYAEKGIWTLDSFYLTDNSGNQSVLSTDELIELGIETELLISGGLEDTTPPELISFEMPTYSINFLDEEFTDFAEKSYIHIDGIGAEIIDNESGIWEFNDINYMNNIYPFPDSLPIYATWISPSGEEQFKVVWEGSPDPDYEQEGPFIFQNMQKMVSGL